MTLHLGLSHHHNHQRSADQQHEVREAKRFLKDRVRDDWDYPPLPAWQAPVRQDGQANESTVAGFRFHVHSDAEREGQDFDALEWRERDYSSSDSDDEPATPVVKTAPRKKSKDKTTKGDSYRFEGPDSVGTEVSARKQSRKRRRREALEEEMTWNDGLSHFMARRDAWCGARTADQVRALESRRAEDSSMHTSDSASAPTETSENSSPRTSTSSSTARSTSTAASSPSPAIHISGMTIAPPSSILIPVASPILPNHPVRRRISPQMYPEMYTKIILQSRTPSVPINLLPMVRALVQGWIEDGEWPPKPGVVEKSIGRKRAPVAAVGGLKDGVKAVGRHLLGMGGGEGMVAKEKG